MPDENHYVEPRLAQMRTPVYARSQDLFARCRFKSNEWSPCYPIDNKELSKITEDTKKDSSGGWPKASGSCLLPVGTSCGKVDGKCTQLVKRIDRPSSGKFGEFRPEYFDFCHDYCPGETLSPTFIKALKPTYGIQEVAEGDPVLTSWSKKRGLLPTDQKAAAGEGDSTGESAGVAAGRMAAVEMANKAEEE